MILTKDMYVPALRWRQGEYQAPARLAARFNAKWSQRPAWVGVHPSISGEPMGDGRDIFTYLFEALRTFQGHSKTLPKAPTSSRAMTGSFIRRFSAKIPVGMRQPNYGDYTIAHPEFAPVDMRKIKSADNLVYTTSATWECPQGRGVPRQSGADARPQRLGRGVRQVQRRGFLKR